MTLAALPQSSIWVTLTTSRKTRPSTSTSSGSSSSTAAQPLERERDRVHPEPGPRRVRRAPFEHDPGTDVPQAAELERVVGRLEADHECRLVDHRRRLEHGRQWVRLGPQLLAREEQADRGRTARLGARGGPCSELHHHREPALHVARAAAVDGAVLDPAGHVPGDRDGVGVPGEQHERPAGPLRVHERLPVVVHERQRDVLLDVAVHLRLAPRGRRDVDERERPLGESRFRGGRGHNAA